MNADRILETKLIKGIYDGLNGTDAGRLELTGFSS